MSMRVMRLPHCVKNANPLLSGDLVLNDLLVKESALDVLDLPVRLEYGRLGIKIVLFNYIQFLTIGSMIHKKLHKNYYFILKCFQGS